MPDLSHKQQEALKNETRFAIWELLTKEKKAMSASLIAAQKPFKDLPLNSLTYHLRVLVKAELVEMVGARYAAVEK